MKCNKCDTSNEEDFNKSCATTCKYCLRTAAKAWRAANKEKKAAYDRQWKADHPEAVKEHTRKGELVHKTKHPERYAARTAVHNAITSGKLKVTPCEVCAHPKVEAHHADYSKPLEVQFLCRVHHLELHRLLKEV